MAHAVHFGSSSSKLTCNAQSALWQLQVKHPVHVEKRHTLAAPARKSQLFSTRVLVKVHFGPEARGPTREGRARKAPPHSVGSWTSCLREAHAKSPSLFEFGKWRAYWTQLRKLSDHPHEASHLSPLPKSTCHVKGQLIKSSPARLPRNADARRLTPKRLWPASLLPTQHVNMSPQRCGPSSQQKRCPCSGCWNSARRVLENQRAPWFVSVHLLLLDCSPLMIQCSLLYAKA